MWRRGRGGGGGNEGDEEDEEGKEGEKAEEEEKGGESRRTMTKGSRRRGEEKKQGRGGGSPQGKLDTAPRRGTSVEWLSDHTGPQGPDRSHLSPQHELLSTALSLPFLDPQDICALETLAPGCSLRAHPSLPGSPHSHCIHRTHEEGPSPKQREKSEQIHSWPTLNFDLFCWR